MSQPQAKWHYRVAKVTDLPAACISVGPVETLP